MKKRRENIIDQLFRSKLTDAKASPPDGMWEEIKKERMIRKHTSGTFNSWRMLFMLLLVSTIVFLNGHTYDYELSSNTTAGNDYVSTKGFSQYSTDGLPKSERSNPDMQIPKESATVNPNDINIKNTHQEPLVSENADIVAGIPGNQSATENNFDASSAVKQDQRSLISLINRSLNLNSLYTAPEIASVYPLHASELPEAGELYIPNEHKLFAGISAGINRNLPYFNETLPSDHTEFFRSGKEDVLQQSEMNQMLNIYAGVSAGYAFNSGFFVQSGFDYRQARWEEFNSETRESRSITIDTVEDGNVVFPHRPPSNFAKVDTTEEVMVTKSEMSGVRSIHYFGIPVKAGWNFHGARFDVQITSGFRSGINSLPKNSFLSDGTYFQNSEDQHRLNELSVGDWNGYLFTFDWTAGVHAKYNLSARYSILAGVESWMPISRNSKGVELHRDRVNFSPVIELRYNF